jgi:hypothetical protein
MNKVVYAALIGCLVASSTVDCAWKWETTGWFDRANNADKREAYIAEVVDPVLRAEQKELEKKAEWADKQVDAWKKTYYRRAEAGRDTAYEGKQINWYRKLTREALEDKQELEKHGREIILGWKDQVELNEAGHLRYKAVEAGEKFREKYNITPEQEEEIVLIKRKPSNAFFSRSEKEKPSVWERASSWFTKKQ